MIKEYNFFDLIKEFVIEVPIIQRDYAQGRLLPNVTYIRERFVTDLVKHLIDSKPMHLGFVYGKIEGRDKRKKMELHKKAVQTLLGSVKQYANQFQIEVETSISSAKIEQNHHLRFIPLDGQQRLTTLFVLFWYLNMRKGGAKNKWTSNFKYNNRKSAVAFFEALANHEKTKQISVELSDDLQGQIQSFTWYLYKWNYDATVSGILVMLQAIHKEFQAYPDFKFDELSLDDINFSFDFLDLDELAQTDELYIKMNERGKLLTDFEHFKAWLQDYASKKYRSEEQQLFLEGFWRKLDTEYLNFFWQNINTDFSTLDDFFFNYLKTMAVTYHLANSKEKEIPAFLKSLWSKIKNSEVYDKNKLRYIPISDFVVKYKDENECEQNFELFSFDALQFLDHGFTTIMLYDKDISLREVTQSCLRNPFTSNEIMSSYLKKEQFSTNLWDHVMYFTILTYHQKIKNVNHKHLKDWLRITRNLIYNTYVQNPENLYSALQSINELSNEYLTDVNHELLINIIQRDNFVLKFFNRNQLNEEKTKSKFLENPNWKTEIEKLEFHPYFYGQINFIFKLIEDNNSGINFDEFKQYSEVIAKLFEKDFGGFLVQRALLTFGDYLIKVGSNCSFCKTETNSLRSRNENWRRVFSNKDKLSFLAKLIKRILEIKKQKPEKYRIENALNSIINSHGYNNNQWEYYFLESTFPIKKCTLPESKLLEIRWNDNDDVRLLRTKAITGYHLELRTIYLLDYLEQNFKDYKPYDKIHELWDKNTHGHPGITLENFRNGEELYNLIIQYEFNNPMHYHLVFSENSEPKKPIPDKIMQELIELGYSENADDTESYRKISIHHIELLEFIKNLAIV